MQPSVLVTGASGFLGHALVERLTLAHLPVRIATRRPPLPIFHDVEQVLVPDLALPVDWDPLLADIDAVVHCAARVHVMHDAAANPLDAFRRINVEATMNLARQASLRGVRRFVFVSSIKVNGESTGLHQPFTAEDPADPVDPYGISKHEAELGLRRLAAQTGMEVVIVRPVLVYGPGVKGNFLSMMRWVQRGIPLPLGAVHNQRSLVALDNLVDLISLCLHHPAAANQTFLVSDDDDLSTTVLLRRTASALALPSRLVPVPVPAMRAALTVVGKGDAANRLFGSLQVDIAKTRAVLGWAPVVTLDEGLRRAAEHFLANPNDGLR